MKRRSGRGRGTPRHRNSPRPTRARPCRPVRSPVPRTRFGVSPSCGCTRWCSPAGASPPPPAPSGSGPLGASLPPQGLDQHLESEGDRVPSRLPPGVRSVGSWKNTGFCRRSSSKISCGRPSANRSRSVRSTGARAPVSDASPASVALAPFVSGPVRHIGLPLDGPCRIPVRPHSRASPLRMWAASPTLGDGKSHPQAGIAATGWDLATLTVGNPAHMT